MIRRHLVVALAVAVVGAATAAVAQADPPAKLSGLDLSAYCSSIGYDGATLSKGIIVGPQAAYNNWKCVTGTKTHPFSMEQACKWAYTLNAVQAHPEDPNNAYTWICYSTAHG